MVFIKVEKFDLVVKPRIKSTQVSAESCGLIFLSMKVIRYESEFVFNRKCACFPSRF